MVSGSSNMYPAKPQHISSDTKDPSTSHMRVFVGNINTQGLDKSTLQQIFRKYGFVTGISIHRGYAFVQYNSPLSARRAAEMENGSMITDQIADVNIAAEPKPNQKPFSSQQQAVTSANNSGDYQLSLNPTNSFENGTPQQDYQNNAYMAHMAKVHNSGVRGMRVGGMKSVNRTSNNKAVHSGRVAKTNSSSTKSAVKSNAKTLVSSVVNLSAVRRELVDIRDRINSLLFIINKSGGIGINQQNITTTSFDTVDTFNNGDNTSSEKPQQQPPSILEEIDEKKEEETDVTTTTEAEEEETTEEQQEMQTETSTTTIKVELKEN